MLDDADSWKRPVPYILRISTVPRGAQTTHCLFLSELCTLSTCCGIAGGTYAPRMLGGVVPENEPGRLAGCVRAYCAKPARAADARNLSQKHG